MIKITTVLLLTLMMSAFASGQTNKSKRTVSVKQERIDSITQSFLKTTEELSYNIPVIDENTLKENTDMTVYPTLHAGRDAFKSVVSFQFGSMRFQQKGLPTNYSSVTVNGLPMMDIASGTGLWNNWWGLNDIFKITESSNGLQQNNFAVSAIGESSNLDIRASKQRAQTIFGYGFSNRAYNHRMQFTNSSAVNKKGWAYTFSFGGNYTTMPAIPGTFSNGINYFFGVDKKMGEHLISFSFFESITHKAKQAAILKESEKILGDALYNPAWGYQNHSVRNANISSQSLPVVILTHEYRFSNQNFLLTSIAASKGNRNTTGLDWYHAPDPRPDYYRYLPSYQTDPFLKEQVMLIMQQDVYKRQINWDGMYEVNNISKENILNADGIVGNIVSGKRARYILENRMANITRLNFASSYHGRWNESALFDIGITVSFQKVHYYKTINDLLGADFYVNWNQFAESNLPTNPNAIQNDLNIPNRILKKGDAFGYDYSILHNRATTWTHLMVPMKRFGFYVDGELSITQFWRIGNTRNGLFADNSFGKSVVNNFLNSALRLGINYSINGKQSIFIASAMANKPPSSDNFYISPRTRDATQGDLINENIFSTELGWLLRSARLKIHSGLYFIVTKNAMDVLSFYHDAYNSFVNYAVRGIGQTHFGIEFGMDARLSNNVSAQFAFAGGSHYFNSRQTAIVTADNTAAEIERVLIYAKNYQSLNSPQSAYSLGFNYRTATRWLMNLNVNFFDRQFLGWNPIRRTAEAIYPIDPNSEKGKQLLQIEKMPAQYLINFFLTHSFSIGRKNNQQWVWSISINNLLNKQDLLVNGYEQLRFDFDNRDPQKFPPKYLHGMGINFLISTSYRF